MKKIILVALVITSFFQSCIAADYIMSAIESSDYSKGKKLFKQR